MFVQRINFYDPWLYAAIRGAVYCSCPLTIFVVNLLCSDLPPTPSVSPDFVVFTVTRRCVQLKPRTVPVSRRLYHRIFRRLPCEYSVHVEPEKILLIPVFRRECSGKKRLESGSLGDTIKDGIREIFGVTDFDFGQFN